MPRAMDAGSKPYWESIGGILERTTWETLFAIYRWQSGRGKAWLNIYARRAAKKKGVGLCWHVRHRDS